MTGEQLKDFRKRQGWTQAQLANLLNKGLDRQYDGTAVGRWENEKRPIPDYVESFLDSLELETAAAATFGPPTEAQAAALDSEGFQSREPGDSAPPPPPGDAEGKPVGQLPLPGGGVHARVCEELWEMVATGVGLVGAVTGSDAMRRDGEIILADKEALGRAWGKLAETNDTFRRMLLSMTSGGAWLEVAMVTGITAGKLVRNHQQPSDGSSAQPSEPEEGGGDGGATLAALHPVQG